MKQPKLDVQYSEAKSITFHPTIAMVYGINQACIIEYIAVWMRFNQKKDNTTSHYRDGSWWTYTSAQKLHDTQYGHIASKTIGNIFRQLEKDGIIKSGNFNKAGYDKTKWYTIIDVELCEYYGFDVEESFKAPTNAVEAQETIKTTESIPTPVKEIVEPKNETKLKEKYDDGIDNYITADNGRVVSLAEFTEYIKQYEDYIELGFDKYGVDTSKWKTDIVYNLIMTKKNGERNDVINRQDIYYGVEEHIQQLWVRGEAA